MGDRARRGRAVAARPRLLLADEPTARLDRANALGIARLLLALAHETSAAIVCATHDPLLIEHADDRLDLERRGPHPRAGAVV